MALSIMIGGDVVPSFQNLDAFCSGDLQSIMDTKCLDLWSAADLRVFNLETPLTDVSAPIKKEGANFKVPEAAINGLGLLRPDAVGLGNNHCKDQGEQGLLKTIELLKDKGIVPFGYGNSHTDENGTVYLQKNGMTVALLSCAETEFTVFNGGECGAVPYHPYWTNMAITQAKQNSDLVVVLYHGGKEYYRYAAPYHMERCRLMVDCGADFVLSQHSHCISCYEQYNGGTILYGQGNFIFHQRNNKPQTKEGLLAEICVDGQTKSITFHPIVLDENDRVCLAEGVEKERILKELQQRCGVLKDNEKLKEEYKKLARSAVESYQARLLRGSRAMQWAARLCKKLGLAQHSKEGNLQLLNLMQNEAHRELFITGLKEELLNDKKNNS